MTPQGRSPGAGAADGLQPARTPVLQAVSLTKHFGGVTALDGVSLWALHGEVTALIGENGAGKSTLVKCLSGVHPADSGQILVSRVECSSSRISWARPIRSPAVAGSSASSACWPTARSRSSRSYSIVSSRLAETVSAASLT